MTKDSKSIYLYKKNWAKANSDKVKASKRKWALNAYKKNPTKFKKRSRDYYNNNLEKVRLAARKYAKTHKKQRNLYRVKHYKESINYRLSENLRNRFYLAIKGINKTISIFSLIGCSLEELKIYLESKFQEGMTWENYGKTGWEIDHIKPCASFDLSKLKEQKKCFNYINLQPLWAEHNRRKHTKVLTT